MIRSVPEAISVIQQLANVLVLQMSLADNVINALRIILAFPPARNANAMDIQLHVIQRRVFVSTVNTTLLEITVKNVVLVSMEMQLKVIASFLKTNAVFLFIFPPPTLKNVAKVLFRSCRREQ